MKNRCSKLIAWLEGNRATALLLKGCRGVWGLLSHNFGLKVLSLFLAVLLWYYVISTNTSITRTKTISGLTGYISNQSVLKNYAGLALLNDPAEQLSDISVVVEVSQADFAYASSDNVQVTLDLAGVRTAGVQEVALKATTSYGRVVSIIPDKLALSFESVDARTSPVNVRITGDPEPDRWYNVTRSNPSALTISGASSVVQSIASAYVYVDVTGLQNAFTTAERYVLLDGEGNEIPQTMLDRSSTSISVSVDVYPTREIPISTELANVITGQPAEGYVVESVSVQPETVVVAADEDLLKNLSELHIEPISVEGLSQSFAARAAVSTLSSFKSISAEEVYVNVTIAEETIGAWLENVKVSFANKGEGLSLVRKSGDIRVYVTGPRSTIEELQETGVVATVNLGGLPAGSYSLSLSFPEDAYPGVTFTPDQSEVEVTLKAIEEKDAAG